MQVVWHHRRCSPPPSSPQTAPSALWPGRPWGRTGRCSPKSSWPAPLGRPRCSTAKSRGTTCWTGGRGRTSRTCPSSLGPCSYLGGGECRSMLVWTMMMGLSSNFMSRKTCVVRHSQYLSNHHVKPISSTLLLSSLHFLTFALLFMS